MVDLFPWETEWLEMPEFVQEKQEPYAKVNIRFRNEEDLKKFSELIGQKMTKKTKSLWFPEIKRGLNASKRWKDES